MGNQTSEVAPSDDVSHQRLPSRTDSGTALAQKFGKTSNWHLKVVIKGDRGTGKSSLFNRLQGKPFATEYVPTETLQSAKVSWNYRTSHDVVNLDVWDVVDAHKSRKNSSATLQLGAGQNEPEPEYEAGGYDEVDLDMVPVAGKSKSTQGGSTMGHLDTSVVDVLRGTHAVVLIFNPMKKWTWQYVKRELEKIPDRIQVLIISNFKDVLEAPDVLTISSETVDAQEVRDHIEFMPKERPVYFLEASMQNCFGLKGLKTFLNLPFLLLQREVIETQLRQNTAELQNAQDEYRLTTENDSYADFLKGLAVRATAKPPAPSTPSSTSVASSNLSQSSASLPSTTRAKNEFSSKPAPVAANTPTPLAKSTASAPSKTPKASSVVTTPPVKAKPKDAPPAEEGGFFSKVFGSKKKDAELVPNDGGRAVEELKKLQGAKRSAVGSVDDFVPETDDNWLQDDDEVPVAKLVAKASSLAQKQSSSLNTDDSDDEDAPNPALARYDEDLDATDQLMMETLAKIKAEKAANGKPKANVVAPPKPSVAPSKPTNIDSDDDDDEDDANPMLAGYEDELDFDDQKIQGKPRPIPVAKPVTASKHVANNDDSDSDGNPSLAGYSEDIDLDDFMPSSSASSPAPPATQSAFKPPTAPYSGAGTPTPIIQPKSAISNVSSPSAVTARPAAVRTPVTTSSSSKKPVVADDSDSDNDLVARDEGEDSDDDYAGFVPKRSAAVVAKPVVDINDLPDFNPLDADDEAGADAFWAQSRQPPPRKPAVTASHVVSGTNTTSTGLSASGQAAHDPFSFGASSGASSPVMHHSSSSKDLKDKDKHNKHKDKHHKHKDKRDKRSAHSGTASPPPIASNHQAEWDFMSTPQVAHPPVASVPPPAAATKKSVFYL